MVRLADALAGLESGRMIQNKSRYPTDEVAALVEFAGLRDASVRVTNSRYPRRGQSWEDGRVALYIGRPALFPANNWPAVPFVRLMDWREALIQIAAHETRHLWQWATGRPIDEDDAELYAASVLERWRAR